MQLDVTSAIGVVINWETESTSLVDIIVFFNVCLGPQKISIKTANLFPKLVDGRPYILKTFFSFQSKIHGNLFLTKIIYSDNNSNSCTINRDNLCNARPPLDGS